MIFLFYTKNITIIFLKKYLYILKIVYRYNHIIYLCGYNLIKKYLKNIKQKFLFFSFLVIIKYNFK